MLRRECLQLKDLDSEEIRGLGVTIGERDDGKREGRRMYTKGIRGDERRW